jgi:hypothetical protein
VRFTPDVYEQDPGVIEALAKPTGAPYRAVVQAKPS